MVDMRNGFPKQPHDNAYESPSGPSAPTAARPRSAAAPKSPTGHSEKDVHAAPAPKARPLGVVGLPKLSAPGRLRDKTSELGSSLALDTFVSLRGDLRQLRRLHDEGGLGADFERVRARVVEHRWEPGRADPPITRAIGEAISQLKAERAEWAALAQQRPSTARVDLSLSVANNPTGRGRVFGQPTRRLVALTSHTARIEKETKYLQGYWSEVREQVQQLSGSIKSMRASGIEQAEILALPEIKRIVRTLAGERALLKKDCDRLEEVRRSYGESLVATRPREMDERVYDDFTRALAAAGSLEQSDAHGMLEQALVPQMVVAEPNDLTQMAEVAVFRDKIASAYPKPTAQQLQPSSRNKEYPHVEDEELLERLARMLAGEPRYVDIKLAHPLYETLSLQIESAAEIERAHAELSKQADIFGELLYSDTAGSDNQTLPHLLRRLIDFDNKLTGKVPLDAPVVLEGRRLAKARDAALDVAEAITDPSERQKQMGESKRLGRLLKALGPQIEFEELRISRDAFHATRALMEPGAARDEHDASLSQIETRLSRLAPLQPGYINREGYLPDPSTLDQDGFDKKTGLKIDPMSFAQYDRNGNFYNMDGDMLVEHDAYYL